MNFFKKKLLYGLFESGEGGSMNFPALQKEGVWWYRKYDDGTIELWAERVGSKFAIKNEVNGLYFSNQQTISIPAAIGLSEVNFVNVSIFAADHFDLWSVLDDATTSQIVFKAVSPILHDSAEIEKYIYILGHYERG